MYLLGKPVEKKVETKASPVEKKPEVKKSPEILSAENKKALEKTTVIFVLGKFWQDVQLFFFFFFPEFF